MAVEAGTLKWLFNADYITEEDKLGLLNYIFNIKYDAFPTLYIFIHT